MAEWQPQEDDAIERDLTEDGEEDDIEVILPEEHDEDSEEASEEKEDKEHDEAPEEKKRNDIQARLDELTRKRRETERRAEARIKELQEESEKKIAELTNRLSQFENNQKQRSESELNQTYEETKARLAQAIERGDTEAQVDLYEKMADLKTRITFSKAAAARQQRQEQEQSQQPETPPAEQPQPPKEALNWWKRNPWFNTQPFVEESETAREIDLDLESEGYDKDSPSYYKELDKRLQERFPMLKQSKGDEQPQKKPRSPVSAPSRSGGKSRNSMILTNEEMAVAKELGLTTKEQLKAYARELQKTRSA